MSATAITGQDSPDRATDQGRMIDPRGHRFGAAMSVVILAIAFVADLPILVAFLALALGASAAFGTRYSILGRPWPYVRKALRIAPPRELEHEYPPRFAQGLGFVGFALAAVLFLVGFATLGWVVAAAVGALQAVLALSGYCLGCRMYFLKWWVPAQFQKLARKTTLA
jgi:O-antigen/teichoic acid export membrane protein